jgi:hypothetical protein
MVLDKCPKSQERMRFAGQWVMDIQQILSESILDVDKERWNIHTRKHYSAMKRIMCDTYNNMEDKKSIMPSE